MRPFKSKDLKPGDLLALVQNPAIFLKFVGLGFNGRIIARWVNPPDHQLDAILRQRDVLIVAVE